MFLSARTRTRSTSASEIGCADTSSSVAIIAPRAASRESVSGNCATKIALPGSCNAGEKPPTLVALRASTSAWYNRPAGSIVMALTSACIGM